MEIPETEELSSDITVLPPYIIGTFITLVTEVFIDAEYDTEDVLKKFIGFDIDEESPMSSKAQTISGLSLSIKLLYDTYPPLKPV